MIYDVNVIAGFWTIFGVVISLAVAIVALYLGWRSNRELYNIRKFEKKESGIQEIIAWAVDVTKYSAKQIAVLETDEEVGNSLRELNELLAKAVYLKALAIRLFPNNDDLLIKIQNLRERISKHLSFLILVHYKKVIHVNKARQIHVKRLTQDCINLINFATNVYTEIK